MNSKILFFPLAVIMTLVIITWMVKPQWDEMKKNNQEIEALVEEKDRVQDSLNSLDEALESYKNVDTDMKKIIENALPIAGNNDDLIAEINTNVVRSNVFVEDLKMDSRAQGISECQKNQAIASSAEVSEDSEDGDVAIKTVAYCPPELGSIEVSIGVIGNYLAVKDFMSKLDAQNRVVNPTGIEISKGRTVSVQDGDDVPDSGGSVVSAEINFTVYYRLRDSKVALSRLSERDAILGQLLTGEIDEDTVEKIQKVVTSDYFRPVTVDGQGREDLFL